MMEQVMKLKRKLRKQKEKQELVSKALDYKEFSAQKNEKDKGFLDDGVVKSVQALQELFQHTGYYGRKSCKR